MARARILLDGSPVGDRSFPLGSIVLTNDGDGDEITYQWNIVGHEFIDAGETDETPPSIIGETGATARLVNRHNGTVKLELVVDDTTATMAIDRVDVLVADPLSRSEISMIQDLIQESPEYNQDTTPGAYLSILGVRDDILLDRLENLLPVSRNRVREHAHRAKCTRDQILAAQDRLGYTKLSDMGQHKDAGIPELWDQFRRWRLAILKLVIPQYIEGDVAQAGSLNAIRIRHG